LAIAIVRSATIFLDNFTYLGDATAWLGAN
jgi:hypothetical protein